MKVLVTGGSGFIGTHLVELLSTEGHSVVNLDVVAPRSPMLPNVIWTKCSILDRAKLQKAFDLAQPTHVVHLAALASVDAVSLQEFAVNIDGVRNLMEVVKASSSVKHIIVASTQHVRKPGSSYATSDTSFEPYLFYGESKVVTEQLTRAAELPCGWTIIRPTAVWGPGHKLLANGLWRLIHQGRYFHPAHDSVVRSYGYVKNVAWQMLRLLETDRSEIDKRVFYVADGNIRQVDWVNAIACELTGREVKTVPLAVIRSISMVGDCLRKIGYDFPLYDSRLKNLVTPNPVPADPILRLLGQPPISLAQGAKETVLWLNRYYSGET